MKLQAGRLGGEGAEGQNLGLHQHPSPFTTARTWRVSEEGGGCDSEVTRL